LFETPFEPQGNNHLLPGTGYRSIADSSVEYKVRLTEGADRIIAVKKFSVALLATAAAAALQIAIAPAASADICADEGFSYVHPALCPAASIAEADAVDEARQRAEGLPPCYTREGVPYYTPGDAPCI
jgi:hypothetical protein